MKLQAKLLRPGMKISVDMGYGGATFQDEIHIIHTVKSTENVFKELVIQVSVRLYDHSIMQLSNFNPEDIIEVDPPETHDEDKP